MEYSLTLSADDINTISAGLAELPLKRAFGVYNRIVEQVRAQEQAARAATQAELDAERDAENARVAAEAKAQRDAAIAEVRAAGQAAVDAEPVERLSQLPGAA